MKNNILICNTNTWQLKKNEISHMVMSWGWEEKVVRKENLGGFKRVAVPFLKLGSKYTAKSLQSCPTLCDPIDGSPPGSPVPGILQARTLEWVAISFSNAWKWKWSCSVMSDPQQPHGLQPTRLLHQWAFPGRSTGVGCHCLLRVSIQGSTIIILYTFYQ